MSVTQHGDFEVQSRGRMDGKYVCRIKHLPTGTEVTGESYAFYTDELEAWKQMAMKLAVFVPPNNLIQVMPDGTIRECPLRSEPLNSDTLSEL